MKINTTIQYVPSIHPVIKFPMECHWMVYIGEAECPEDRERFFKCWVFPVKPTKKQMRILRRLFRNEYSPLTDHEEIVISVLGME